MLKSLHIENIAVIERTDIEFTDGFNVLTGETGAGKSIIIDAINAILGERTSKELIRTGCDNATVSAVFCELSDYAAAILNENGFGIEENGELHVMRRLYQSGNGVVKIGGQNATVGTLKTIGKYLINIHGQHDSQSLLDPENHYVYVDRLADNGQLFSEYYEEFRRLNGIRRELSGYETDEAQKKHNIELLNYQIKELTDADIKVGEADELKQKLRSAQSSQKIMDALNTAYSFLNGDESSDGAFSSIRNAQKEISVCEGEDYSRIDQRFSAILADLDDLASCIRQRIQNNDSFDVDIKSVGDRLDFIYRITMKYGGSEQSAIDYLDTATRKLRDIELSDKQIADLSKQLDDSTEKLIALGKQLSISREKAAAGFEKSVTDILHYLDMPDAKFEVGISQGKYTKHGCDIIEFMIRTNAGETVKPLSKIASGGELSRVMLAIKSVLADYDDVDTLIFDEIDSGISGRAAEKVGHQLKVVSNCRQTVCVTHLAQIASFAVNHLLIEKSVSDNRTFTSVKSLKGDERIGEIARIMAGSNLSENIYKSAKEMLERTF